LIDRVLQPLLRIFRRVEEVVEGVICLEQLDELRIRQRRNRGAVGGGARISLVDDRHPDGIASELLLGPVELRADGLRRQRRRTGGSGLRGTRTGVRIERERIRDSAQRPDESGAVLIREDERLVLEQVEPADQVAAQRHRRAARRLGEGSILDGEPQNAWHRPFGDETGRTRARGSTNLFVDPRVFDRTRVHHRRSRLHVEQKRAPVVIAYVHEIADLVGDAELRARFRRTTAQAGNLEDAFAPMLLVCPRRHLGWRIGRRVVGLAGRQGRLGERERCRRQDGERDQERLHFARLRNVARLRCVEAFLLPVFFFPAGFFFDGFAALLRVGCGNSTGLTAPAATPMNSGLMVKEMSGEKSDCLVDLCRSIVAPFSTSNRS
jgi:hypothetical protein